MYTILFDVKSCLVVVGRVGCKKVERQLQLFSTIAPPLPSYPASSAFEGEEGGGGLEVQASLSAFQKIGWEKEGVGVRLGVSGGKNGV